MSLLLSASVLISPDNQAQSSDLKQTFFFLDKGICPSLPTPRWFLLPDWAVIHHFCKNILLLSYLKLMCSAKVILFIHSSAMFQFVLSAAGNFSFTISLFLSSHLQTAQHFFSPPPHLMIPFSPCGKCKKMCSPNTSQPLPKSISVTVGTKKAGAPTLFLGHRISNMGAMGHSGLHRYYAICLVREWQFSNTSQNFCKQWFSEMQLLEMQPIPVHLCIHQENIRLWRPCFMIKPRRRKTI